MGTQVSSRPGDKSPAGESRRGWDASSGAAAEVSTQAQEAAAALAKTVLSRGAVWDGEPPSRLPTLIAQFDKQQRLRAVNPASQGWFGKPEAELVGKTVADLLGEDFQRQLAPFVKQALGGKPATFEFDGPAVLSGPRRLRHQLVPLRDARRRVGGFCATVEDITPGQVASDSPFLSSLRAGAVGAWNWDLQRNVIFCDDHMWQMFDVAEVGQPLFLDKVHTEDRSRVAQAMGRSITAGGGHEVVYRLVSDGKPLRHVASRGSVVETRNGKAMRLAGVCFDVTHRMRTEEELRRLNATLEYQRATALSLMRDAEEEMFRAAHAREDVWRHQQFLDSIVENIPSMVLVKDAEELRFLHANKATERLLGRSRDELIGKTEFDLLPQEQAAGVTKVEREVIRSKQETSIPEQVVDTAEGKRILHTRKLPILDDQGNARYLLAISDDITDRKLAEEALAKERSLLRTVIDNLPDYIFAKDTESRFILNNRAHAQFVGATFAADVLGKSDHDFFPAEVAESYRQDDQRVMQRSEQVLGKEEPIVDKTGARRWLSTTKVPLKKADGAVIGLVGLSHDVTDRKTAAERMERMVGELARSNSELEQFAYVASHDLQEPLRKIQAFSSRLRDRWGEQLGDQGADYLNRVENAASRMQILIEDLLAYSRVTSKAKPFVPVKLDEIVVGVLSDLEARIERLNARVELEPLPELAADPTQMRQLMQNLIGNALKFHRSDSTPVVKIRAEMPDSDDPGSEAAVGESCRLIIQDNGIGFDPKHAAKIFQVFQRLHSRQEYQGSGIGLAVCKKIVDRHGGTIEALSAPGQGATFVVTLPMKQAGDLGNSEGEASPPQS